MLARLCCGSLGGLAIIFVFLHVQWLAVPIDRRGNVPGAPLADGDEAKDEEHLPASRRGGVAGGSNVHVGALEKRPLEGPGDRAAAPLAESEDAFADSDPLVAAALSRTRRQMQQLGSVPKILHITVKRKINHKSEQPLIKYGVGAFMKHNPSWRLRIHEDADVVALLKRKLPQDDWKLIKGRHIVEMSDLWRLVVIYYEGGMYMDIDRLSNRNMSYVAHGPLKMLLPVGRDFGQDFVCSAPRNPVIWTAIQLNLARRRACRASHEQADQPPGWAPSHTTKGKICGIYSLGPLTYLNALSVHLLGKQLNRGTIMPVKGETKNLLWEAAVSRLTALKPYVRVYREVLPFDSVLFRKPSKAGPPLVIYNESTAEEGWEERVSTAVRAAKFGFYKQQGSKYWSGRM